MAADDLTPARVRELFDFDPLTGHLTWRVHKPRHKRGPLGTLDSEGYRMLYVGNTRCLVHRLGWAHFYGAWPKTRCLDHKNGMRDDNRIENLREATDEVNQQNRHGPCKNNRSGYLGVSRVKSGKWYAKLQVRGKQVHLGLHDTPEAAHAAYLEGKRRLHEGCTI